MATTAKCHPDDLSGFVFDTTPRGTLPEWQRTAFVRPRDGAVFLSACFAGDERSVTLCAAHDSVSLVSHRRHAYLPASWLKRERPDMAPTIETVERWAEAAHQKGGAA